MIYALRSFIDGVEIGLREMWRHILIPAYEDRAQIALVVLLYGVWFMASVALGQINATDRNAREMDKRIAAIQQGILHQHEMLDLLAHP